MIKIAVVKFGIIMTLLLTPMICFASNSELLAVVKIDPTLKPQYAADVEIKEGARRETQARTIMELLAGSLIYLAGPLAVFMLALGGLRYVMSHGDQTQMEEAKKTITYAIIGLIVIVLSYAIVRNVINLTLSTGEGGSETPPTTEEPATPADPPPADPPAA
jgi:hypothetical protein